MKEAKMHLIQRYVAELGRYLPRRIRAEVEAETTSTLMDALEDKARERQQEPDNALEVEVLKDMDPPRKMAARYVGTPWLIGPRLYFPFLTVTRIMLIILVAAHTIPQVVAHSEEGIADLLIVIGESLDSLLLSALTLIGLLGLTFVFIERVVLKREETEEKDWDPRNLPGGGAPFVLRSGGTVIEVAFMAASLILINLYPGWIGVYLRGGSFWKHVQFLSPSYWAFALPLNLILGLRIVLLLLLLRKDERRRWTDWVQIILTGLGMAVLSAMIVFLPTTDIPPDVPINAFVFSPLLTLLLVVLVFSLVRELVSLVTQMVSIRVLSSAERSA